MRWDSFAVPPKLSPSNSTAYLCVFPVSLPSGFSFLHPSSIIILGQAHRFEVSAISNQRFIRICPSLFEPPLESQPCTSTFNLPEAKLQQPKWLTTTPTRFPIPTWLRRLRLWDLSLPRAVPHPQLRMSPRPQLQHTIIRMSQLPQAAAPHMLAQPLVLIFPSIRTCTQSTSCLSRPVSAASCWPIVMLPLWALALPVPAMGTHYVAILSASLPPPTL